MIAWLRQHRALGIANGLWMGAVMWLVLFMLIAWARASDLPNAPSMAIDRAVVETYAPNEAFIVHNTPSRAMVSRPQRLVDWSFILGHGIYAGASAFDAWETQRHLGVCAFEGNPDLGRNPSAKAQAIHGAVEFGVVVAGDLALKWIGRRQGVPRWMNMLGGNLGSAIGAGKHLRGGMEWVRLCR